MRLWNRFPVLSKMANHFFNRRSEEQLELNIKDVLEASKELSEKIGHVDKDEK